jgi:hypothetical protein
MAGKSVAPNQVSRFIPLSDNQEIFAVMIHVLQRFRTESGISDWLRRAIRTLPGDIVEGPLGSDLIRHLYDDTDPLTVVLRVHLYVEVFLDTILTRRLKYPALILKNRDFTFAMKLDLLRASNQLDLRLFADIKRLNALRNRFAHDLRFSIAHFDMSAFTYCADVKEYFTKLHSDDAKALLNIYIFQRVAFSCSSD